MASNSLTRWLGARAIELDQIRHAHARVGGPRRGRRYATDQINYAYAMLLSSQFQGFCRDLHSEAVDNVCGPAGGADARMDVLRLRMTSDRKQDFGNPNPGNIGSDFAFFNNFKIWDALKGHDPANEAR